VRELLDERVPGSRHWAGVACYPAHAFQEDELLEKAEQALAAAHLHDGGGLEIAAAQED
jgi:hypothetical protein